MPRPVKRSFTIRGHRTSFSLETSFWSALREVAQGMRMPLAQLVQSIDSERGESGLSSAVRIWLLKHYQGRVRDLTAAADKDATPVVTKGQADSPSSGS